MSSQATRIKQIKKERKDLEKLKTARTSVASINNIKARYPSTDNTTEADVKVSDSVKTTSGQASAYAEAAARQSKTDWGGVAKWYDGVVNDNDSYQAKVVLPNITRVMGCSRIYDSLSIKDSASVASTIVGLFTPSY